MQRKLNKLQPILWILLMSLLLGGCSISKTVLAIDETMPRTPKLELAPYWIFDSAYSLNPDNQDIDEDYFEGLSAYLSNDRIIIGSDSIEKPNLKAMQVKTYEYFLTRYKIAPSEVGLNEDVVAVYTVTDAKGFSERIYKLNDERIAIERNNILLYFNQTDHLEQTNIEMDTDTLGEPVKKPPSSANGLLLGLRKKRVEFNGVPGESDYRTLWIAQSKDKPLELYEVEDILFPRNVFYKMSVERQENIDVIQENIVIQNLADGSEVREVASEEGNSRLSDITFVSNDYFSVRSGIHPGREIGGMQFYSTRNVSNPQYDNRIGITDIFGPEGINVMDTAAKIALSAQKPEESVGLVEIKENSFILKRYNGRWIYEGRINAEDSYEDNFLTYPMNFRDNYRVYRYDNLTPRWSEILSLVPDAQDAVASPDAFFTVIRTKSKLLIYPRQEDGSLKIEPLVTIPLDDEEIIMHEWALGDFVGEWSKIVKQSGRPIDLSK